MAGTVAWEKEGEGCTTSLLSLCPSLSRSRSLSLAACKSLAGCPNVKELLSSSCLCSNACACHTEQERGQERANKGGGGVPGAEEEEREMTLQCADRHTRKSHEIWITESTGMYATTSHTNMVSPLHSAHAPRDPRNGQHRRRRQLC